MNHSSFPSRSQDNSLPEHSEELIKKKVTVYEPVVVFSDQLNKVNIDQKPIDVQSTWDYPAYNHADRRIHELFPNYSIRSNDAYYHINLAKDKDTVQRVSVPEGFKIMGAWHAGSFDGHTVFVCEKDHSIEKNGTAVWEYKVFVDDIMVKEGDRSKHENIQLFHGQNCAWINKDTNIHILDPELAKLLSIQLLRDGKLQINNYQWKHKVNREEDKIHVYPGSTVVVLKKEGSIIQNDVQWNHKLKNVQGNGSFVWGKSLQGDIIVNDKTLGITADGSAYIQINEQGDFLLDTPSVITGNVKSEKKYKWVHEFQEIKQAVISESGNVCVLAIEKGSISPKLYMNDKEIEDMFTQYPIHVFHGMKFIGEELQLSYENLEGKYVRITMPIDGKLEEGVRYLEEKKKFRMGMEFLENELARRGLDPATLLENMDGMKETLHSSISSLDDAKLEIHAHVQKLLEQDTMTKNIQANLQQQLLDKQNEVSQKDKEIDEQKKQIEHLHAMLEREKKSSQFYKKIIDACKEYIIGAKSSFLGKKKLEETELLALLDKKENS